MITPTSGPPSFDPAAAHPEVESMRAWCRQSDWPALARHFDGLTSANELFQHARIAAEVPGVEQFLVSVAEREPARTLPKLLLGARCIELAWEVRTGARAQHVSREQFDAMHRHLRDGEQLLLEVTAREPGNAAAWALRLINVRGLELGQDEAQRRYDRLARTEPHMMGAQVQMLQQLCPKWSGSWEKAFAFARQCAAAAPDGSLNPALVAEAHMERWLELDRGEDEAYLRRPEVQHEVAEMAARSVLHPAFRPVLGWTKAHGYFAAIFSLAGDHRRAAVHFRALGGYANEFPWVYLGDQAEQFVKHRDLALKRG